MNEHTKKYLDDILAAINEIEDYLGKKRNFFAYQQNKMLKSAVERQLIIIGEATNRVLATEPNIEISAARRIVQFRNKLTHEYDVIVDTNVWAIIVNNLPTLKTEIKILLEI